MQSLLLSESKKRAEVASQMEDSRDGRSFKVVTGGWSEKGVKRRTMVIRGNPLEAAIGYEEKRRSPRYSFIASAELIEERADVRIATRVSELSLHGCYLDMMNPFPKGTMVLVKISAGDAFFEAKSQIVYSQPNMGAGVGFLAVEPASQIVLERWLDELEREQKRLAG
jgi:hypothetical protein